MPEEGLVVDTVEGGSWLDTKKYGSAIIIIILIMVVASVAYCKADGFASPDGVTARRSQRQVRSDTNVDKTWNLAEFETSIALLNRKSGAYN